MTPAQFELVAHLARFKPNSKAREAARLYLTASMRQAAIASQLGISQATVSQAVKRFMRAWATARRC
jgi:DNA-binding transcriptional regulator LsrR (DeoR family)